MCNTLNATFFFNGVFLTLIEKKIKGKKSLLHTTSNFGYVIWNENWSWVLQDFCYISIHEFDRSKNISRSQSRTDEVVKLHCLPRNVKR
jgi:hypothetical protein